MDNGGWQLDSLRQLDIMCRDERLLPHQEEAFYRHRNADSPSVEALVACHGMK